MSGRFAYNMEKHRLSTRNKPVEEKASEQPDLQPNEEALPKTFDIKMDEETVEILHDDQVATGG